MNLFFVEKVGHWQTNMKHQPVLLFKATCDMEETIKVKPHGLGTGGKRAGIVLHQHVAKNAWGFHRASRHGGSSMNCGPILVCDFPFSTILITSMQHVGQHDHRGETPAKNGG